jgi:hypothetical protein
MWVAVTAVAIAKIQKSIELAKFNWYFTPFFYFR